VAVRLVAHLPDRRRPYFKMSSACGPFRFLHIRRPSAPCMRMLPCIAVCLVGSALSVPQLITDQRASITRELVALLLHNGHLTGQSRRKLHFGLWTLLLAALHCVAVSVCASSTYHPRGWHPLHTATRTCTRPRHAVACGLWS